MLTYLNHGERSFFEHPTLPVRRKGWEFLAVVEGRCAPTERPGQRPHLEGDRLWAMPADGVHGWTGVPEEPCQILVAHFDQVPEALSQHQRAISVPLTPEQVAKLKSLFLELEEDYIQPTELTRLRAERLLLELSITVLADRESNTRDTAQHKVAAGLAWYAEHLAQRPSVEDVARSVSVSPSHLRRLFMQAMGVSPLEAMKQVQHDRAKQLMKRTDLSLNAVSAACGFSAQSVFSRDFAKRQNITPQAWRKQSNAKD
ncbi:AraC family transcriptional regulator [Algisphaera agarilytica]|uniref:AraC-like DNA-binding protein n=1 Tax=Algisphaera agarilytica TaxID=1385975 RepID=A0A7X0H9S1_9BACT|nr:AraC family transcriptional regulator [Algisphaera agarilytica]MBB6430389.1 AraC-like DNA-binding protein [Algisphaera agarilytica]